MLQRVLHLTTYWAKSTYVSKRPLCLPEPAQSYLKIVRVLILDGATLQQRWVLTFLWSEAGGTLIRIAVHHGEYRITQRKTYEWYDSKLAQQMPVMRTAPFVRPLWERRTFSKSVRWSRRKGGLLTRILQAYQLGTSCGSTYSTTHAQDQWKVGYWSNCRRIRHVHVV